MKLSRFALLLLVVGSLALIGGCSEECDDVTTVVQVPELDYVGSETCGSTSCHPNVHDMWTHSGHPYKLTKIDGGPPTAGFPIPSAYQDNPISPPTGTTWDDFSYTIGGYGWKMRWIQNDGYIYTPTAGGNQFNFEDESWGDYHEGETKAYNCGSCHTTGWEDSDDGNAANNQDGMEGFLGTFFAGGVHCENCHGKGSQHAYEPATYDMEKDDSSEFCGKCHTRGGTNGVVPGPDIIEAKGGFIKHHEQYDEWYNSPHNSTYGPGCNDCHNPHASVKFDAEAPGEGVRSTATCESCHVDGSHADIALVNHDYATCVDCHMPDASKSAIANDDHRGDVSTHLWNINTSINGKTDMFNAEGTAVAIDETSGWGSVSLEFACYGCHNDPTDVEAGGDGTDKTMQELVDKAVDMHTLVAHPKVVKN